MNVFPQLDYSKTVPALNTKTNLSYVFTDFIFGQSITARSQNAKNEYLLSSEPYFQMIPNSKETNQLFPTALTSLILAKSRNTISCDATYTSLCWLFLSTFIQKFG